MRCTAPPPPANHLKTEAMPIRHCIVHLIEKKPDGTPAILHARETELGSTAAMENLLADLNESYNAKEGKAWGLSQGGTQCWWP